MQESDKMMSDPKFFFFFFFFWKWSKLCWLWHCWPLVEVLGAFLPVGKNTPKTSTGPTGELEGGAGLRPAPAGRALKLLQKSSRYRVLLEGRLAKASSHLHIGIPTDHHNFAVCDHYNSVYMRDFFLSQFPPFVFRFTHFTLKKIFVNKKKSAQSDLGKVP